EIGRIHERRAAGIQLRDESIVITSNSSLEGTRGREISRVGTSGNVSVSGRIYSDTSAEVVRVSAEIGRIHERRAGGVQLGHESISKTPMSSLEGARGREVNRSRKSRHIGVYVRIYGHTSPGLIVFPAEIGRIHE